jgi:hypothetical protein
MDPVTLVAAAAQAVGPVKGNDIGGWSERVRLAAAAQVVIATDMERLHAQLSDPDTKIWVRKITGVRKEKGWFFIEYEPPTESRAPGGNVTAYSDIHTDWADSPHARTIAKIARDNVGRWAIFYQSNNKDSGRDGQPAAGYRQLAHLEPAAAPAAVQQPSPDRAPAEEPPVRHAAPVDPGPPPADPPAPPPQPDVPATPPVELRQEAYASDMAPTVNVPSLQAFKARFQELGTRQGQFRDQAKSVLGIKSLLNPTDIQLAQLLVLLNDFEQTKATVDA